MAVLWEQRKMVRVLQEFENEEGGRLPYGGVSIEKQIHNIYSHPEGHWLWESVLIKEMLKKQGKSESDIVAILANQKLLNACIKDEFILERPNGDFTNIIPPIPEGVNPNANSSPRRIRVSEDKGVELLNGWYFWWKYIAGSFPPLTSIVIAVLTALLTSGIIWLFAIEKIEKEINRPPVEYENQQIQTSPTLR